MTNQFPSVLQKIIKHKIKEIQKRKQLTPLRELKTDLQKSDRDFAKAIAQPGLNLIAEIKKQSPTLAKSKTNKMNIKNLAKIYEENNVRAISVLCDKKFFGGSLTDLQTVKQSTKQTPVLCKEFIIDEYQIYEARHYGADAILLLANVLNRDIMQKFIDIAKRLKMDAICEIHTKQELKMLLTTTANIIMINNRNLNNFKIDLDTTDKLTQFIPEDKIIISASGISGEDDVQQLPRKVNAILVGTSIMTSPNPANKIKELQSN